MIPVTNLSTGAHGIELRVWALGSTLHQRGYHTEAGTSSALAACSTPGGIASLHRDGDGKLLVRLWKIDPS